jgi:hypothetical protein
MAGGFAILALAVLAASAFADNRERRHEASVSAAESVLCLSHSCDVPPSVEEPAG